MAPSPIGLLFHGDTAGTKKDARVGKVETMLQRKQVNAPPHAASTPADLTGTDIERDLKQLQQDCKDAGHHEVGHFIAVALAALEETTPARDDTPGHNQS
jgi:hypothetical protein